jgi:hypothetical protein
MAGGMNKRGSWGPMSDRLAQSRGHEHDVSDAPAMRHCWVNGRDGRLPALLLEWRHDTGGWMGRVVRPVLEAGGWVIVEEWVPAELLERA